MREPSPARGRCDCSNIGRRLDRLGHRDGGGRRRHRLNKRHFITERLRLRLNSGTRQGLPVLLAIRHAIVLSIRRIFSATIKATVAVGTAVISTIAAAIPVIAVLAEILTAIATLFVAAIILTMLTVIAIIAPVVPVPVVAIEALLSAIALVIITLMIVTIVTLRTVVVALLTLEGTRRVYHWLAVAVGVTGRAIETLIIAVVVVIVPVHRFRPADGAHKRTIGVATRTHVLLTERHDDAIVVLGVLQIVFCQNRVTGRRGVARQRHVFLGNMGRCAPNFDVRAGTLKAPRHRVLRFAVPAAAAAILLSLPHKAPVFVY